MGITVQLPFPRGVSRSLVVQDRFHLTGLGFGVMLSVYAGGYLLGYVVAPAVAARFPRARICVGSLLGAAGGFSLVAAAANPLLAGLGLAFTGLSSAQVDVVAISYRQAAVPDRVLGRVLAGFLFRRPRDGPHRRLRRRVGRLVGRGRRHLCCGGSLAGVGGSLPVVRTEGGRT